MAFKEPQPRKLTNADLFPKVPVNAWPPYERQGGEANWEDKPSPNAEWTMSEVDFYRELDTAREEGRVKAFDDLEIRTTALEAAVQHFRGMGRNGDATLALVGKFEDYLRNGKPS